MTPRQTQYMTPRQTQWATQLQDTSERIHDEYDAITQGELNFATKICHGEHYVEKAGRKDYRDKNKLPKPNEMDLPVIAQLEEMTIDTCKGGAGNVRLCRHVKQAHAVWKNLPPPQQALMLGRAGQAGRDSAQVTAADVEAVAAVGKKRHQRRPDSDITAHEDTLYGISVVNKFGLPFCSSLADADKLPATCPQCRAPLYVDAPPGLPIKAHVKLHIWQAHGGRCGGKGGQALQQHETIKGAVKWHVFCGDDPAGPIFKDDKLVDYEERHLRNDNTKPGDVTASDPACPLQRKLVMDAVAKSCTSRTALRNGSASSPDQIMHEGEGDKFSADSRSRQSLQTATSMRFIPLASNHLGRRGWHFEALLLELSFHIVHKPSGCRLMQGTFAMSADQAAADIRRCWGARLTWTTQRAHAMNIAYAIARMDKLLSDS